MSAQGRGTRRQRMTVMMLAGMCLSASALARQPVPVVYEAGHFYATPALATGQRLRLLVDTGGAGGAGWFVMGQKAVSRLGLATERCQVGEGKATVIKSMAFRADQALPASAHTPCQSIALVLPLAHDVDGEDGLLGAGYLPGHVWTFDYPGQALWLESSDWKPGPGMRAATLGFPRDKQGRTQSGFARISVTVGGEPLDFLLDTGATAHLTEVGRATKAPLSERGIGVASYITTSVLDRWHRMHPSWRVIEHGDSLSGTNLDSRLIEVPEVEIAGWHVGSVWFTERPDANFADKPGGMSSYMDQSVVGAVGGNVFMHFTMTIDYPGAKAWFACGTGCQLLDKATK